MGRGRMDPQITQMNTDKNPPVSPFKKGGRKGESPRPKGPSLFPPFSNGGRGGICSRSVGMHSVGATLMVALGTHKGYPPREWHGF